MEDPCFVSRRRHKSHGDCVRKGPPGVKICRANRTCRAAMVTLWTQFNPLTAYSCIFMFKGEIFLGLHSSLREKSNLLQITHLICDLNRHIPGECSFSVVSWIKHHFCFISMAHLEKKRKQINEAVLTLVVLYFVLLYVHAHVPIHDLPVEEIINT